MPTWIRMNFGTWESMTPSHSRRSALQAPVFLREGYWEPSLRRGRMCQWWRGMWHCRPWERPEGLWEIMRWHLVQLAGFLHSQRLRLLPCEARRISGIQHWAVPLPEACLVCEVCLPFSWLLSFDSIQCEGISCIRCFTSYKQQLASSLRECSCLATHLEGFHRLTLIFSEFLSIPKKISAVKDFGLVNSQSIAAPESARKRVRVCELCSLHGVASIHWVQRDFLY